MRFTKRNKIILFIVLGLLFLGGLIKVRFFKVTSFSLKTEDADCLPANLGQDLGLTQQNLLLLSQTTLLKKVSAKYLCVDQLSLSKKIPNSVEISIVGKKAVLELFSEEASDSASGSGFLIDSKGLIFEQGDRSQIPKVGDLTDDLRVGESLRGKAVNTILIENKLKELNLPIFSSKIEEDSLLVESNNPKKIVFNLNADVKRELASLQLILQAGKMNSMESLDLRFSKPVVVYTHKI